MLQAQASAVQASFEPPFLRTSRLAGWRHVGEAVEALLSRVACLESAVEGATGEGIVHMKLFRSDAGSCVCLDASNAPTEYD